MCATTATWTPCPEANRLFAALLWRRGGWRSLWGSSSLTLMHDAISRAVTNGVFRQWALGRVQRPQMALPCAWL